MGAGHGPYIETVRFIVVTLAIFALCVGVNPAVGAPTSLADDPLDRAARLAEASVYIVDATYPTAGEVRRESGLAFAVSTGGHLLTALHVVEKGGRPARRIFVRLASVPEARTIVGRVVATDPRSDLALVRIAARDVPALMVRTGGDGGGGGLVAFGRHRKTLVVRRGSMGRTEQARPPIDRMVTRIRMPVRSGDSGGPVVDSEGKLVGINTMITGPDVGFAIPAHVVKAFLKDAIGNKAAAMI